VTKIPVSVEHGAALLDERLPGWRAAIDADSLDLSSGCDCVLGQVFGDFNKGEAVLDLSRADSRRLGFFVSGGTTYTRLTAAWRRVIGS
jgi:hypothetical protein